MRPANLPGRMLLAGLFAITGGMVFMAALLMGAGPALSAEPVHLRLVDRLARPAARLAAPPRGSPAHRPPPSRNHQPPAGHQVIAGLCPDTDTNNHHETIRALI